MAEEMALLTEVDLAPAETEHVPDGMKSIGDVYEVPKGATVVFFVLDYSACGPSDVKAEKARRFVRTRVEFSMNGVTFGATPDGDLAYRVGEGDEARSFTMWSEQTFNSPELGSPEAPDEKNRCGDVAHPEIIGPGITHVRFSYEILRPGVKCGFKVAFR